MIDRAKNAIAQLLSICNEMDIDTARDIVDETQNAVNDFIGGDKTYDSVSQILFEFLGLSNDYSWIFLYDD